MSKADKTGDAWFSSIKTLCVTCEMLISITTIQSLITRTAQKESVLINQFGQVLRAVTTHEREGVKQGRGKPVFNLNRSG